MATCSDLPVFPHVTIETNFKPPFELGTILHAKCNFGYVLMDGDTRFTQCELVQGKGEWSSVACIPRSCGDPGKVEHADRIGSNFTFPNRITFQCDEGFRMRADRNAGIRYCDAAGKWYPEHLPVCEPVTCPELLNPDNGSIRLRTENSSAVERGIGSLALYACDEKYKLSGTTERKCQADGTWDGEAPVCELTTCPDVPVEFGTGVQPPRNIYKPGYVKLIKCYDGSIAFQKCQNDGTWLWSPNPCPPAPKPDGWDGAASSKADEEDEDESDDDREDNNVLEEKEDLKPGMGEESKENDIEMVENNEDDLKPGMGEESEDNDIEMVDNNNNIVDVPDDSTKRVNPDIESQPTSPSSQPTAVGTPTSQSASQPTSPSSQPTAVGTPTSQSASQPTAPTTTSSVLPSVPPTSTTASSVLSSGIQTSTSQNSTIHSQTSSANAQPPKMVPPAPKIPAIPTTPSTSYTTFKSLFNVFQDHMTSIAIVAFSCLLIIITTLYLFIL